MYSRIADMNRLKPNIITFFACLISLQFILPAAYAEEQQGSDQSLLQELTTHLQSVSNPLEELVKKSSSFETVEGFASYYARRFEGRRTTSGHRYNPEKLTAAHESLPIGTVVRVVNPISREEVQVTITDRCAPKPFHFIDLSRAAAKKIGLWGKGKIKVVIIPILEDRLEKPA